MIQDILRKQYGLEPLAASWLTGGFIHRVLRVDTTAGPKVVKLYQGADWTPEKLAPSLVAQVAAERAGLPVPRLLTTQTGDRLTWSSAGWMLVTEFIPGHQIAAAAFTPELARAIGACLGQIHTTLAHTAKSTGSAIMPQSAEVRQRCLTLLAQAQQLQRSDEGDRLVIEAARFRIELLERYQIEPEQYAADRVQMVHGDFYPQNLLFGPDRQLTAVVDWDFAQANWLGIEVARAAVQCAVVEGGGLDRSRVVAFLAGYSEVLPLTAEQRHQMFGLWLNHLLWSIYPLPLLYTPGAELPQAWADLARSRHRMLVLVSENLERLQAWAIADSSRRPPPAASI